MHFLILYWSSHSKPSIAKRLQSPNLPLFELSAFHLASPFKCIFSPRAQQCYSFNSICPQSWNIWSTSMGPNTFQLDVGTYKHSQTLTGTDQLPFIELNGYTLMAWPMVEQFWSLKKCSSSGNYSPQHDKKSFRKVLHN